MLKRSARVVSIAGMPDPATAPKDLGRGNQLPAPFRRASLSAQLRAARHGLTYRFLFMHAGGTALAHLASLIDAKKLEVVIDPIFPFAEAKEAACGMPCAFNISEASAKGSAFTGCAGLYLPDFDAGLLNPDIQLLQSAGRGQMRHAMRALIDKGEPIEAHLAFWASFVVVGEGAAG